LSQKRSFLSLVQKPQQDIGIGRYGDPTRLIQFKNKEDIGRPKLFEVIEKKL